MLGVVVFIMSWQFHIRFATKNEWMPFEPKKKLPKSSVSSVLVWTFFVAALFLYSSRSVRGGANLVVFGAPV